MTLAERAETWLRLLAEAELREALKTPKIRIAVRRRRWLALRSFLRPFLRPRRGRLSWRRERPAAAVARR